MPRRNWRRDEQALRNLKMPTDAKGLIEFFEAGSLKEGEGPKLEALVRKLDSAQFREREAANKEVVMRGPVVLPFLKSAMEKFSLEGQRRADTCIKLIEERMRGEAIGAAARVLAARNDPKAARALFDYLPAISTDAILEEEVLGCVGRMTVQPGKVDPLLADALKDRFAFRRGAAAYLIGLRGGADPRQQLRDLLSDSDAGVRQRVVEGLFGKRPAESIRESATEDDKLLRGEKIDLTKAAVLDFLGKRTLSEKEAERLRGLIRELGAGSFVGARRRRRRCSAKGPESCRS